MYIPGPAGHGTVQPVPGCLIIVPENLVVVPGYPGKARTRNGPGGSRSWDPAFFFSQKCFRVLKVPLPGIVPGYRVPGNRPGYACRPEGAYPGYRAKRCRGTCGKSGHGSDEHSADSDSRTQRGVSYVPAFLVSSWSVLTFLTVQSLSVSCQSSPG
eukprot:173530-Rhodomonas_salina.1